MLSKLIPLPVFWLGAYVIGRLVSGVSPAVRCWSVALASLLVLLAACGPKTCALYSALGLGILLAGSVTQLIDNDRLRRSAFTLAIVATVLMIALFLLGRIHFQKVFVFLPSLSYLGFRGIAYLTSAYRRRDVPLSAGMLQMFFLPAMFAGPISRVENFEQQRYDYDDVLQRIVAGFAFLIAGRLCAGYILDLDGPVSYEALHWSAFWIGAAAISFELYFTFAGFSELVIGLGLLFGFKLPENFNKPYLATSVSEFWRRWHMSLSFWIRDYVYFPLGGSRKGTIRKCLNLIVAMTICGLWHGAALNFLLWGAFHGFLLAAESVCSRFAVSPIKTLLPRIHKPVQIAATWCVVSFGWLLFTYPVADVAVYLRGMFGG